MTEAVLNAARPSSADEVVVWVLIQKQPDGTWGAGGTISRRADLDALTKERSVDA